jgi:uncharacterized membrane protein YbhN (UPF0104 family)
MTELKRFLRRLLFWGLPVAIFYIVFKKVDLELLKANVLRVDLVWLVAGLSVSPLIMVLGASRWYYQLRIHISDQITLAQTSRFYWMGFPLTLFFPSGLGWDAHRALVTGRKYGRFAVNIGVIFVEKIIALVATMLLIVTVYPFALSYASSAVHQQVFNYALLFLSIILLVLGITTFSLKYHVAAGLLDRADRYFTRKIKATLTTIGASDSFDSANTSIRNFLVPLANPRRFGPVLIFSLAIQIASAVAAQIYFIAAGYDIPFAVNLFVVPFIFLALVLPISFGGLGIREAAYIILYGQFGVPMEIALLVSFFTLIGVLLNYTIGGVMLWHHGAQKRTNDL